MREMEARRREKRRLESREEEIEHLQEQLRHQGRRPTEALHQTATPKVKLEKYDGKTSIIQWWFKFLTLSVYRNSLTRWPSTPYPFI